MPYYTPRAIEPKWQQFWAAHKTFRCPDPGDPAAAERAYARFRAGDQFVASGYVHEYEFDRGGETVQREEFVARRIGHDTARTRYSVERPATERATGPESGRDAQRTVEPSSTAVGI